MKITGAYKNQDFMAFPKIVLDECAKQKINKVLLDASDIDLTNISTMQSFYYGEEIAKVLKFKVQLAIASSSKSLSRFAETVASNRGANMKVFSDVKTADEWLENEI